MSTFITIVTEEKDFFETSMVSEDILFTCTFSESGTQGVPGLSAYEVAVKNGYVGTEQEWLDSLKYKPLIRRHDFDANASYCGSAFQGTEETAASWNIIKIEVSPEGTTIKKQATNVDWINRLTHNYI